MEYDSIVRTINIVIALVCLIGLFYKMAKHWSEYQTRTRDFWWVLTMWTTTALYSSVENLFDWHTQIRILFTFLALVLTVRVIFQKNEVKKPTLTKEF